jgi:hypothetical protein
MVPAKTLEGHAVSLRSTILATACAAALATIAGPAFADGMTDFSGILSGDYSNISASHGGGSINSWGGSGSGMFGLGSNFAAQIDAGYHNYNFSGGSLNDWNVDGSAFWRGTMGRIGAVVGYNSVSGGGAHGNVTNYGGFGEWFASSMFTVGLKGGAFTGGGSSGSDYLGAAATFYAMPDLSFTGGYDYDSLGHGGGNANTWSITAEWLVSERTPISIYAGYDNTSLSGGGSSINTWTIGIRLYTDPEGPAPLVERQRSGAETWGPNTGTAGSLLGVF